MVSPGLTTPHNLPIDYCLQTILCLHNFITYHRISLRRTPSVPPIVPPILLIWHCRGSAMALHELSDKEVRNTKPTEKEYLLADGGGLFLRVRPTGAKDWLFVYTCAGNRRKLGLGSLEAVPLATARSEAAKARESIKQQIDPQVQRKQRQAEQEAQRKFLEAAQARQTVQDLFDRWAEVDLVRRKDGGKEIRRMFERTCSRRSARSPSRM